MRVIFYDDSDSLYVTKEQGTRLKQAMFAKAEWVEIGGNVYAIKSIKKVLDDAPITIGTPLLAPPTTELTDEQRQKNIERIRQMKRDFLSRKKS